MELGLNLTKDPRFHTDCFVPQARVRSKMLMEQLLTHTHGTLMPT